MYEEPLSPELESQSAPSPDTVAESMGPSHVVGIGASAGGLEALEQFFAEMPHETGLAFVVVQHLSPDFKSLTDILLARRTEIPIYSVEDGMEVRANAIYLLPPRREMIIADGKLLLTDKDPSQLMTMPIDHFFRSLAQDAGDRSIGVILSGTGSDGSRGIREIHEAGGLVIAQKPETAKFDGMPNSAEKTGVVDFILPPEEMAEALLRYTRQEACRDGETAAEVAGRSPDVGMDAVFRLLRDAYGIDFSYYRPATVIRRTERRLQMNDSLSLNDYVRKLEEDPEELNALYKDLLIGVTRFFRDKDAYESLATTVLPQLLAQSRGKDEEFRIWVAGCATGEEAYSLAILVQECLLATQQIRSVKIFATDVHRASLEFASAGIYEEACLSDIGSERLARYFIRKGEAFQVIPELRKMVVFAPHNVIKDAPFTKLDLVSCRNLLIYLQPLAQKKALSLFHFGLKTAGAVFLGPSETPGELADEFDTIDSRWRIYRKRRDIRLATDVRLAVPTGGLGRPRARGIPTSSSPGVLLDNTTLATYDVLLSKYMPPSLLVSDRRELIQSFAGAQRYLKHREGRYSADILEMVDPDLRMALTGALQRALKEIQPVSYRGIRVSTSEGEKLVNVTVEPIQSPRSGGTQALIMLQEIGEVPPLAAAAREEVPRDQASLEQVQSLETELRFTKENLQATIEELETSNEELQATNEELVASNEELQSTNEELHSVNEELFTVNAEYQKKIAELTELTTDVENLLSSTEVHTVFLDKELNIRKFTPRIAETFNFLPQDVGRRIDSFTHSIDYPHLLEDLQTVLRTSTLVERQVRDQRGNWFLLRILPYRVGLSVEGVVLTMIDIALLKRVETEARNKDQQLAGILQNSPNPICISDREGRYVISDESFKEMAQQDPIGKTARDIFPERAAEILIAQSERVIAERTCVQAEVVIDQSDGTHTYLAVLFALQDEHGEVSGVGNIMTDVTPLKLAESRALEAVMQRDRFLAMLSHELRNPLAAILNASAAAVRTKPDVGSDWLQVIDRRARHMARLLDDLLDMARLTQNKIEIRKTSFDLGATTNDVVEEVQTWFERRQIELSVRRHDEPLIVEGDPARLQQIQVNLLMNAAKYTSEGGRVWYTLQREEDKAVIRVRDNGAGIPEDMLNKVFDLFVQADNMPERSGGGIGVGLTLVRSIVELHGGQVKAYSEGPGKGSEFIVRLPLVSRSLPTPTRRVEEKRLTTTTRIPAWKILIVEDDEDIRETLQSILEHDGAEVRGAGDGPTALKALEEIIPQVALLDLGLPGMSGNELARAICHRYGSRRPRLVALTGYGQRADRQATREAGFDAHLTKPLQPDELYRTIQTLLADGNNRADASGS